MVPRIYISLTKYYLWLNSKLFCLHNKYSGHRFKSILVVYSSNFGVNNILLNSNNTSIKQIHTKLSGSDNKHLVLIEIISSPDFDTQISDG